MDVGRNRQSDPLRRLQIDDELELGRLLDGKVGWLRALQDLVDVSGGAARQIMRTCTVDHEPTDICH